MRQLRPTAGGLALLCVPLWLSAQAPLPSLEVVRQKETLVRNLLADSPAGLRINRSGNTDAIRHFEAAQDHFNQGLDAMRRNDLATADKRFNDAVWSAGRARQLVPDPASAQIDLRVRYAGMLAAIESVRKSYVRHSQRARGAAPAAPLADPELDRIDATVEQSRSLANSERLDQAVQMLSGVEHRLMVALSRVLGTTTLEYAQRFETEAEEFAHELDRNRSLDDLVPLAIQELKPTADATRLIDRYREQSRKLAGQAQQEAAARDTKAALKSIRSATAYLQRALLAAGLVTPPEEAATAR